MPEVLCSAAEVLCSVAGILRSAAEVLCSVADILRSAAEVQCSVAEILRSAAEVLGSVAEVLRSAAEVLCSFTRDSAFCCRGSSFCCRVHQSWLLTIIMSNYDKKKITASILTSVSPPKKLTYPSSLLYFLESIVVKLRGKLGQSTHY